jgi:hypothetical protein
MTGTRLGNWILGPEVGRGGVGVVYKATAADGSGQPAALKVITAEFARDPAFLARFPADLLALRRLTHPNVCALYDGGVHAGLPYYASEWAEGTDLATRLKRNAKAGEPGLSWRDTVVSVAVQVARALNHGHRRSLLHRDLKPANVILAENGTVKVTDFGVAKSFARAPLSLPPEPWGTAAFLAPELFSGKAATKRSDLYALGGVLYAALTGRPPFAAISTPEFLHKHTYTLPDRPANFLPKLPAELDDLVCNLLAKDPNRRPAAAASVVEECDKLRGKLERRGDRVAWPVDPGDTALHAPLSETTVAEAEGDEEAADVARPKSLFARPAVVVPLFAVVCGLLLFALFRPGPGADELYRKAEPLMASADPADWDTAWDEYLEPLSRKYPDRYADEVNALRERRAVRRELTKAVEQGKRVTYSSEAERLYLRGVALLRLGDREGAAKEWHRAVATGEPGGRWAEFARAALTTVETSP